MPDVICQNPACQKVNAGTRKTCHACGWILPLPLPPTPPTPPQPPQPPQPLVEQHAALVADHAALQDQHQQLVNEHDQLADQHQQLQDQHQQLQATNQELGGQNAQLATTLSEAQKTNDALVEQKQQSDQQHQTLAAKNQELAALVKDAPAKIVGFENLVMELRQKVDEGLTTAEATYSKYKNELMQREQELKVHKDNLDKTTAALSAAQTQIAALTRQGATGGGTAPTSLLSQLLKWGMPVAGLAVGMTAGVFSPLNSYKTQFDKLRAGQSQKIEEIAEVRQLLEGTKKQLTETQQQVVTEQQKTAQMTDQLNGVTKNAQASTTQLSAVQAQLAAAKATIAKDSTSMGETQRQLQTEHAANQQLSAKAAQLPALQSIIDRHPSLTYKGPTQGVVTIKYTARNDKPETITIDHFRPSADSNLNNLSISGTPFPNVPFVVEPVGKNVAIVSPPTQSNGWQKLILSVQGKGSNQAVVKWSVF